VEGTLRDAARDDSLRLIETLLWDGARFPRLAGHLARLEASAARLGFACDAAAVRTALAGAVRAVPLRVRLTLAADGAVAVTVADLPPARADWRIGLAQARLRSDDPWLRVKTTRRAVYDAARAGLPADMDELIFQNERGEVCDGTITTVFFDRGAGLRTPPLSSGVLPGVLRAGLLDTGMCREEVLMVSDLPQVRLWVGNALRGRMRAVFK
jgi:4-amino-4-deoxychorismate lyase